jgi:uncharacterized Zn ribbon protein
VYIINITEASGQQKHLNTMEQNQLYLIKSGQNSFVETEGEVVIGFSGGNIGFGTTNPETFMHVTGNAQIDGDLTVKGDFTTVNSSTIQVDDKNIEIGVGANTDAAADGGGITLHGATQKTINWADTTDAWTSSEHLHTADGKHIASDQIRALDGEGLKIYDDGGNGMFVQDGGNVGVGTTNPGATFDVVGSGNFSASISAGTSVDATTTMSAGTSLTTPTVKAADANGLNLQDDDGNGIVIADGGNVTIQEDLSIGGNLTVAGNTTTLNTQTLEIEDHNIVIASNTGYNQLTDVYPVGGDYAGVFWGTGDAGAASPVSLTYQSNKGFAFEGGNVGIGITNPGAKLHVHNELYLQPGASDDWNTAVGKGLYMRFHDTDGTYIQSIDRANTSNKYPMIFNASEYNFQDGNVGIGTTNPRGVLDLGSGSGDGTLSNTPSQYQLILEAPQSATGDIGRNIAFVNSTQNVSAAINSYDAGTSLTNGLVFATAVNGTLTESMRITHGGNVGIGTTSPSGSLEVQSDRTSGDLVKIKINPSAEGNPAGLHITNTNANLSETSAYLKITDQSGAHKFRINKNGNVLVGTTDTFAHVSSSSGEGLSISGQYNAYYGSRSGGELMQLNRQTSNGEIIRFRKDGTIVGNISVTSSATSYNTTSDYRLKTDVQPMTGATERLKALKPVNFEWISSGTRVDGFIAHEVQEIVPEAISGEKDAVDEDDNPDYQGIDQSKLVPLLTAAIQEQQQIIEDLKSQNESLAAQNADFESRISQLEQ